MFSDQQLVTGIALLTTGFTQLNKGITSYHWSILVYLSWFSSLTHLTTITVLKAYFLENRVVRSWRIMGMGGLGLMLCAALWPTGNDAWFPRPLEPPGQHANVAVPAICYFRENWSCIQPCPFDTASYDYRSIMVLSFCVLFTSYVSRFIKVFETSSSLVKLYFRKKPGNMLKQLVAFAHSKYAKNSGFFWRIVHEVLLGTLLALRVVFDIVDSMIWEVGRM